MSEKEAGGRNEGGARNVRNILTGITERKQEERLRNSSEEIAEYYQRASCGYHSLDKDGIIRRINDTELGWLGYTREEVAGIMNMADLLTPAGRRIFRESYPRFIKQGFVHDLELELIRKDGTILTGLVSAVAIYGPNGAYVLSHSTVSDISGRKRDQEQLRIAAIAFQSQEAMMVTDASGIILRVNDAFTRITGYSAQEVIGKTPAILQSGQHDENFFRGLWSAIQHDHYWEGEIWNRHKDGVIFLEWQTISAVVAPDGSVSHYIGSFIDITERKQLEIELQERRNKMNELIHSQVAAQTAAAIAHEMNQPLLAIASYSSAARTLLQAERPDLDKIRNAVEASEQQAHRAGKSIRELIEFLNLKEFPKEPFDLNKDILGTLKVVKAEHELKFHTLLELEQHLPAVLANRMHVQKVLLNLLLNSIEAMQEARVPSPSITVYVSTINDGSAAQVTIKDNGPGIGKADFQRLFKPFFTTKTRGIGMGLAVSRSLIEANGGQLWVDPQPGPGAIFHLTLPFAP